MGTSISGYKSSFKSIVNFRSAYLKAVAKSWSDDDYKNSFITQSNILKWEGFNNFLPDQKPLPWTAKIKLIIPEKFEGFNLETRWMPGPTAGWFGINDTFIINLPPAPEEPKDYSNALAAYNQMFPTLMGNISTEDSEGLSEDFVSFSCAMLQAIALCWATKDQPVPCINASSPNFEHLLCEKGLDALGSFIGYVNPWGFNIVFKPANSAKWNSEKQEWSELFNEVHLNYPAAPTQHGDFSADAVKAVALAQYNADGMQYPFTCP